MQAQCMVPLAMTAKDGQLEALLARAAHCQKSPQPSPPVMTAEKKGGRLTSPTPSIAVASSFANPTAAAGEIEPGPRAMVSAYHTLRETRTAETTLADPSATNASTVYLVEPLKDPRWDALLNEAPEASVFHSSPWLEALRRTYGYQPIVYTTSAPRQSLQNGIVFCCVDSWLTGCRLVSLPFSDHCQPLARRTSDLQSLIAGLGQELRNSGWRYIEIRSLGSGGIAGSPAWEPAVKYFHHQVDLTPDLGKLYDRFQKSSIQRKIRRATREGLTYQDGSTEFLLDSFYRLFLLTRQRHRLPPQPRKWFLHLMDCFGEALRIRLALKDGRPIAGIITLRYKDTLVYKYGGSDARFHSLGGMHLLYWRSIQEAKGDGLRLFDLGRSEENQTGLITFKRRWGATQTKLTYSRYCGSGKSKYILDPARNDWKMRVAEHVFAHAPIRCLPILGSLLYHHAG